jgi:hypothetical protein
VQRPIADFPEKKAAGIRYVARVIFDRLTVLEHRCHVFDRDVPREHLSDGMMAETDRSALHRRSPLMPGMEL